MPETTSASNTPTQHSETGKLPFVVFLLAVGTFLMCTSEYLIAGLLTEMASDLHTSLAATGLLITAFAIGMIVGSPVMALATLRLPRRSTLILALVIFAAGHVLAALSSDFAIVLTARVITALATGAFWSVASAVATAAAGPAQTSKALGVMMSGVGLATVVGVPAGSWAGQHLGWRGAFWALAALAVAAAVLISRFIPADDTHDGQVSVTSQLRVLRSRRLWLLLAGTVFVTGGYMATFSYISPLITEHAGYSTSAVPLVLVGYGVGALIGTNLAGRFADRSPLATFITAAVATALVMGAIVAFSQTGPVAIVLIVALGIAGMAVPPVATGLAVRFASTAPSFAAGLAVAGFNGGIALGSWIAGDTLDTSLGATGPALVGVVMAVVGLVPLLILTATRATADRPSTGDAGLEDVSEPHHAHPVAATAG